MKKKLCIVGLISLLAWNALLGAFGGLLLCIHQDLDVHVDGDTSSETNCADAHEDEADSCLSLDESCVDIELVAELLPATRLKSETALTPPEATLVVIIAAIPVAEPTSTLVYQAAASRAPPQARWLTDFYLQTTVLRV